MEENVTAHVAQEPTREQDAEELNTTTDSQTLGILRKPPVRSPHRSNKPDNATQFDTVLEQLLPIVERAFSQTRPQIAMLPWSVFGAIVLLPFHLHLRWPKRVDGMAPDATFAYAPFSFEDEIFTMTPLYEPIAAVENRRQARLASFALHPASPLVRCDWEQAVARLSKEKRLTLPGCSFLAIERIDPDGSRRPIPRPVLGRRASRSDFRPVVAVPSKRFLRDPRGFQTAGAELLIANLQRTQAPNTARLIKAMLSSRPRALATMLIAASPADLLFLDQEYLATCDLHFIGESTSQPETLVITLGNDSLLAEREFKFRLESVSEASDTPHLVTLAKNAWWAMRQAVGSEFRDELSRFESALEAARSRGSDVAMFDSVRVLLTGAAAACDTVRRTALVVDAVLAQSGRVGTLVVTRNAAASVRLRSELASLLGFSVAELSDLGIRVAARNQMLNDSADVVISCGFFGPRTFDAAMRVGAKKHFLILDAVEVRFAAWAAGRLASVFGATPAGHGLRRVESDLQRHLVGTGSDVPMEMSLGDFDRGPLRTAVALGSGQHSRRVHLTFTDGSYATVPAHARFDLFSGRKTIRTVSAETLTPGDSVILLESESHAALSDQLLQLLDSNRLQADASRRAAWIDISRVVFRTNDLTVSKVARRMTELGEPVDRATIRTWLNGEASDASAPATLPRFRAFADALGLPSAPIDEMFQSIARLRRVHRRAGRTLARAIRAVHVDRLDVVALRSLQSEWGFDPQKLLSGARVVVIDEVELEGS